MNTTPDWNNLRSSLDSRGFALLPNVLSEQECNHLKSFYDDSALFRSTIDMKRYRFGRGEYKYFNYPLPPIVQSLRNLLYTPLSVLANEWATKLKLPISFPAEHKELLRLCHDQNQNRPTPLILKYGNGGFNTLHQDLYGQVYFPFQVVLPLSQHGKDYEGGEFVLTEQVPRAQSRAVVLKPSLGDALIFTTNYRPVNGTRGYYRVSMKHGVSEITSGERFAMGIIFHDAQ